MDENSFFDDLNSPVISIHYVVSEHITTFKNIPNNKSFNHEEVFKEPDILNARKMAFDYYRNRLFSYQLNSNKKAFYGTYFKGPDDDFDYEKNHAYSITISIEVIRAKNEYSAFILGDSDEEMEDGRTEEVEALKEF